MSTTRNPKVKKSVKRAVKFLKIDTTTLLPPNCILVWNKTKRFDPLLTNKIRQTAATLFVQAVIEDAKCERTAFTKVDPMTVEDLEKLLSAPLFKEHHILYDHAKSIIAQLTKRSIWITQIPKTISLKELKETIQYKATITLAYLPVPDEKSTTYNAFITCKDLAMALRLFNDRVIPLPGSDIAFVYDKKPTNTATTIVQFQNGHEITPFSFWGTLVQSNMAPYIANFSIVKTKKLAWAYVNRFAEPVIPVIINTKNTEAIEVIRDPSFSLKSPSQPKLQFWTEASRPTCYQCGGLPRHHPECRKA